MELCLKVTTTSCKEQHRILQPSQEIVLYILYCGFQQNTQQKKGDVIKNCPLFLLIYLRILDCIMYLLLRCNIRSYHQTNSNPNPTQFGRNATYKPQIIDTKCKLMKSNSKNRIETKMNKKKPYNTQMRERERLTRDKEAVSQRRTC